VIQDGVPGDEFDGSGFERLAAGLHGDDFLK
jgi:hypothetical protein